LFTGSLMSPRNIFWCWIWSAFDIWNLQWKKMRWSFNEKIRQCDFWYSISWQF
jgi:hypothetical protein